MGPPVYFVVNNTAGHLDLTKEEDQNKLCLGLPGNFNLSYIIDINTKETENYLCYYIYMF